MTGLNIDLMKRVMIDTHIVIWLYINKLESISRRALDIIESHDLFISPIILLELQYLYEINKLSDKPKEIYKDLRYRIGLEIEEKISWAT